LADDPPHDLLEQTIATWTAHASAADQIAQTIRTIVLSDQFRTTWGKKVKRPLEFVASLLRAVEADFTPDPNFLWMMDQSNQRLFRWPTPTGHPDKSAYWLGASVMLDRWTVPIALLNGWQGAAVRSHLLRLMPPEAVTCRQVAAFWIGRLLGYSPDRATASVIEAFACRGADPEAPLPGSDPQEVDRVTQLVGLIAMTPEFHLR
jgi:hypothetical protein